MGRKWAQVGREVGGGTRKDGAGGEVAVSQGRCGRKFTESDLQVGEGGCFTRARWGRLSAGSFPR
jgi:hypothetical protein